MRRTRIALLLGIAAGALALMGWGVTAAFTDSGTATANISVGTFGITLSSSTPGAVVFNGGNGVHTITYTAPPVLSSAAGSAALDFQVNNTGTIPATVTVTSNGNTLPSPFSDMFVYPGSKTIAAGGNYDYTGGIQWTQLGNPNLGEAVSVTYTISATG